jgi:hypothetical protein
MRAPEPDTEKVNAAILWTRYGMAGNEYALVGNLPTLIGSLHGRTDEVHAKVIDDAGKAPHRSALVGLTIGKEQLQAYLVEEDGWKLARVEYGGDSSPFDVGKAGSAASTEGKPVTEGPLLEMADKAVSKVLGAIDARDVETFSFLLHAPRAEMGAETAEDLLARLHEKYGQRARRLGQVRRLDEAFSSTVRTDPFLVQVLFGESEELALFQVSVTRGDVHLVSIASADVGEFVPREK